MEGAGTGGSPAPAGRAGPSLHWEEGVRRPPFLQTSTPPPGGGLGRDQPRSLRLLAATAGSGCARSIPRKCEAEFPSAGRGKGLRNNSEAAGRSGAAAGSPPSRAGLHRHLKKNPSSPGREEGNRRNPGSRLQRRFRPERDDN